MKHITVLKEEAVLALNLKPDAKVIDATFGAGGHAGLIINKLNEKGIFVGIDADKNALHLELEEKKNLPKIHLVNQNFSEVKSVIEDLGLSEVDAILADLGWRTDQFTDGKKGFSFQVDEPLIMTFGNPTDYLFTAKDIVNDWDEENIADIIYAYGEERYSRRIAKAIVEARKEAEIETTKDLVLVIEKAVPAPYRHGRTHFATKTFQALRMAVNDELSVLSRFINEASDCLASEGSLAIITFHSLEDRIVKLQFKELVQSGQFVLQNKKPITPSRDELLENRRSRSAKLRIIKKISVERNYERKSHYRE